MSTLGARTEGTGNLVQEVVRLVSFLPARRRIQLAVLSLLLLAGAAAEMATLGAVIPFLSAFTGSGEMGPRLPGALGTVSARLQGESIGVVSALFACIAIVSAAIRILLAKASYTISFSAGVDLERQIFSNVLNQPYQYHLKTNSSETVSALTKCGIVVTNVLAPAIQAATSAIIGLSIVVMIVVIDPLLAAASCASFVLLYWIANLLTRARMQANGAVIAASETERIKSIQEGLGSIREVIVDATQRTFIERFAKVDVRLRAAQSENGYFGTAPRYIIEGGALALIAALAYAMSQRQGGLPAALPVLGALAMGAQRLLPQAQAIYWAWAGMVGAKSILLETLTLLSLPVDQNTLGSALPASGQGLLIEFSDVSFAYSAQASPVLRGVSFAVRKGQRIGIIGTTGSGKSTLVDLFMGLLSPTQGQILIAGQAPLAGPSVKSWQRRVAHVPQAIYLADTSILENIAFGTPREQIDIARVMRAATRAQLAEFIESLDHKYETVVGERGCRLSGGQRQRIGIARALYKEADILVLDEATSALDEATEAAVIECVDHLGPEISLLMISHRPSTLRHCDAVLRVSEGQASWLTPQDG